MKKVLVRAYSARNLGDDLFLDLLFKRYPDVDFWLLSSKYYKKWFKGEHKNINILLSPTDILLYRIVYKVISIVCNQKKANRYMLNKYTDVLRKVKKKTDAYIYIGGSLFMETDQCISFGEKLDQLFTEIYSDKPKFIIGANFGPFVHNDFLDYYKKIFIKYEDVCFRDKVSYSYFEELSNVRYETDIVFQFLSQDKSRIKNSVGISLIDLSARHSLKQFHKKYLEIIKLITLYQIRHGRQVYFYSFCKPEGDESAIDEIIRSFSFEERKNIETVYYRGDIDNFLSSYMKMEIAFPTRFHAMVLSLVAKQKICPIIYSNKMTSVLQDLNFSGDILDIRKLIDLNQINIICEGLNAFELDDKQLIQSANSQFRKIDLFLYN